MSSGKPTRHPQTPSPVLSSSDVVMAQAGMPHLLAMLTDQYRQHMTRKIEEGAKLTDADVERTIEKARPLLAFFEAYLREYRPVQVFPVDSNYGVLLSNSLRCVISPGVPDMPGMMQDSGAVTVTTGQSNPGQEGVVPVDGLRTI